MANGKGVNYMVGARQLKGRQQREGRLDSGECVKCQFSLILLALRNP